MSCTYQDIGDVKQYIEENARKRQVKTRKENRKLSEKNIVNF